MNAESETAEDEEDIEGCAEDVIVDMEDECRPFETVPRTPVPGLNIDPSMPPGGAGEEPPGALPIAEDVR